MAKRELSDRQFHYALNQERFRNAINKGITFPEFKNRVRQKLIDYWMDYMSQQKTKVFIYPHEWLRSISFRNDKELIQECKIVFLLSIDFPIYDY